MKFVFLFLFAITSLSADSISERKIDQYKELLINGTYEGADWSSLPRLPLSRYDTFRLAFNLMENKQGPIVVELGTSRSFVHGGLPGCNNDDPGFWQPNNPSAWDWGAGFFTRMAAECLQHLNPQIHTLDIARSHIARCKIMTSEYSNLITYHVNDSVKFLNNCNFPDGIDLLYLDTGDMTPIEPTALLQLEEAKAIVRRNLISDEGIILIDDVKNTTPRKYGETSDLGKSKYSLPYLLDNGFEIIMNEYQVILKKKIK